MIKIICGEDVVASRNYFQQLKNQYQSKKYTAVEVSPEKIIDLDGAVSNLFDNKNIYFSNFVYNKISVNKNLIKKLEEIDKNKNLILYIFEEKSKYDLKHFKNFTIIEFKLSDDVFKLLDNFIPNNKIIFSKLMDKIIDKKNESMFFYLLVKRLRELLIVKSGVEIKNKNLWYRKKIEKQSDRWSTEKLIQSYQGLLNIEKAQKTSSTPYSIKESLDIWTAYYL